MNPSERLLSLYSMLLLSNRDVSLKELARQMECSKQTIMRDIEKLESSKFGKILCEKQGRESIYRLERPRNLPRLALNATGLQQLALCRAFLMHLLPEDMREQTENTLQRASAYLPEGEEVRGDTMVGQALAKGSIDYTLFEKQLNTIIAAIQEQKVCDLHYRTACHGEEKKYSFAPKRLVAYHEALYGYGWIVSDNGKAVPLHDKPAKFPIHRMVRVKLTRRSSGHLPEVIEDKGCFGLIDGEPFKVRVRFAPSAAAYVMERTWSADQELIRHHDGSVTLSMTARNDVEVLSWVLSFADTAELLSPHWLRENLVEKVKRMAEQYEKQKRKD